MVNTERQVALYCDGSYDYVKHIGTWGCKILYRGKEYDYSGVCSSAIDSHECELRAIVKGLGKVKSFKPDSVVIYTDCKTLSESFDLYSHSSKVPVCAKQYSLWFIILKYFRQIPNVSMNWINRGNNVSHNLAYVALVSARR